MVKRTVNIVCMFCLLLAISITSIAQDKEQKKESVTHRDFKGKIFELKHRDPNELFNPLRPLLSGFTGADLTINSELKTVSVRDFPENIAMIEEAIKRLDVPRSIQAEQSVELSLHVLLANIRDSSRQLPGEIPNDLKDVVKQLQNTFSFKNYHLASTILQRVASQNRHNGPAVSSKGSALWDEMAKEADGTMKRFPADKANYRYEVQNISISHGSTGPPSVRLDRFFFEFGYSSVLTTLEARDGEKLVVGTSTYGDKALILVLTVKVLK